MLCSLFHNVLKFMPLKKKGAVKTDYEVMALEGPTIKKLRSFSEENGSPKSGQHLEIYLNDMPRAVPEN